MMYSQLMKVILDDTSVVIPGFSGCHVLKVKILLFNFLLMQQMGQKKASNQKTEKQQSKIVAGKPTGVRKWRYRHVFFFPL